MIKLHTKLQAEITVLTPLHISTGRKLVKDFDWVEKNGRVYVINQEKFFDTILNRAQADKGGELPEIINDLMSSNIPDLHKMGWLTTDDFRDPYNPIFRYVLTGKPHMNEIGEQIKDVYGHSYLPGSSLKGALRTMLFFTEYVRTNTKPDLRNLGRSRSWAAQQLERQVFGCNPNYDWLRALHVSDSPALAPEVLRLEGVQVFPKGQRQGLTIDVESIKPQTTFTIDLTIDEYGFQGNAMGQLQWDDKRKRLRQLPRLAREHTAQRLEAEAHYYTQKNAPQTAQRGLKMLIDNFGELGKDQLMLQLGWGGGWDSKTLSVLIKQKGSLPERFINEYRMVKRGTNRREGDLYPNSRRFALRNGEPALPMGWVKIKLTELS